MMNGLSIKLALEDSNIKNNFLIIFIHCYFKKFNKYLPLLVLDQILSNLSIIDIPTTNEHQQQNLKRKMNTINNSNNKRQKK